MKFSQASISLELRRSLKQLKNKFRLSNKKLSMVRDTGGEIFHNSKYQKIKINQKIVKWYDGQFFETVSDSILYIFNELVEASNFNDYICILF